MKRNLHYSFTLLTLILFISPAGLFAQQNIKLGPVSIEDLKMTYYAADTTAHAVILYDKGHLESTTRMFTRHVRLKVLKQGGTAYANFQVSARSASDIQGSTFNLVGGQIQQTKLAKENVFKEEILDGFYTYKIFFPSVKPGSIIELKYSFMGLPPEWRFQERIPVIYSELVLEPTRWMNYKTTKFGNHPLENNGFSWVARDVPAFQEEPFMSHFSNYLIHFRFDIRPTIIRGGVHFHVDSNWEKIGEQFIAFRLFGGVLRNSAFLNDKAKELGESDAPLMEKIHAAYDYIKENIKWNGWATKLATENFAANFKKNHTGNSAEINLLLTALLQKAGIKTHPVLLSTRDSRLLNPANPTLTDLNYVIACVKTDSIELLLDATEPELVPGLIPERCRNVMAFVVDPPGGWWIETNRGTGHNRKLVILIRPDTAGNFIGQITNTHENYDYLEWIKKYNEIGSEENYARFVMAESNEAPVKKSKLIIEKEKLRATDTRTVGLSNTQYVQDLGDEIFISPFLFSDITNPFRNENRQHPIDFIYPRSRSILISVQIPQNYILRNLPEPCRIAPASGGASFTLTSSYNNNLVTIICNFTIEKQIFAPAEYTALRNFFVEVQQKISQPLQIDKKT